MNASAWPECVRSSHNAPFQARLPQIAALHRDLLNCPLSHLRPRRAGLTLSMKGDDADALRALCEGNESTRYLSVRNATDRIRRKHRHPRPPAGWARCRDVLPRPGTPEDTVDAYRNPRPPDRSHPRPTRLRRNQTRAPRPTFRTPDGYRSHPTQYQTNPTTAPKPPIHIAGRTLHADAERPGHVRRHRPARPTNSTACC